MAAITPRRSRDKSGKRLKEARAQELVMEAALGIEDEPPSISPALPEQEAAPGNASWETPSPQQPYMKFLDTFPPKENQLQPLSWEDVGNEFPALKPSDIKYFIEKGVPPELVAATLRRGTRPHFDFDAWEIQTEELTVPELRRAVKLYNQVEGLNVSWEDWLIWANIDPKLLYHKETVRTLLLGSYELPTAINRDAISPEWLWVACSLHHDFLQQAFESEEAFKVSPTRKGRAKVLSALNQARILGENSTYQEVFDYYYVAKNILDEQEFRRAFYFTGAPWEDIELYKCLRRAWGRNAEDVLPPAEALSWSWELCHESPQYNKAFGWGENGRQPSEWEKLARLNKHLRILVGETLPLEDDWRPITEQKQALTAFINDYAYTELPIFSVMSWRYMHVYAHKGKEHLNAWIRYFSAHNIPLEDRTTARIFFYWGHYPIDIYSKWRALGFEKDEEPPAESLEYCGFSINNPDEFKAFLHNLNAKHPPNGEKVLQALAIFEGDRNAVKFYYDHSSLLRRALINLKNDDNRPEKDYPTPYTLWHYLRPWIESGAEGRRLFQALGGGGDLIKIYPETAWHIYLSIKPRYYKKLVSKGYTATQVEMALDNALIGFKYEKHSRGPITPIQLELAQFGQALRLVADTISLRPEIDDLMSIGQVYRRYRNSRQGKAGGDAAKATVVLWEYIRELPARQRYDAISATTRWYVHAFTPEQIVAWWRAGWPPSRYAEARQAVKAHPSTYTFEELIASATLMYGFSRGQ